MVHTTVNTGFDITDIWHTSSAGDKRSSKDNHYLDWLNDMRVGFYEEADYGVDWAGTGSGVDVETTFPTTPSNGVIFVRVNTNAESGNLREYRYNGDSAAWEFNEFRGAISVPTRETGLTSAGVGSAIIYGNTAARLKHTMSIKGTAGSGSIQEIEVEFQTRQHSSDDFVTAFSLIISDLSSGTISTSNFIEIGAAEVRRNILVFDVTGDSSVDITITSN